MEIKTVSIIGLGALGTMYANHFSKKLLKENLRIIADKQRIDNYIKRGIFCNNNKCEFKYISPDEITGPADLVIFSVKFNALNKALSYIKNQIGPDTIILSLLNGITSEKVIGNVYGVDKLIYCVAQGMDAVKKDNELTYHNMGVLCFGIINHTDKKNVQALADFFDRIELPYELENDMNHKLWSKFMLNCGVNQAVAVFETNYGGIQVEGEPRKIMIASMREVLQIAVSKGIYLTESDIAYWMEVLAKLHPEGKPSMRQDLEAKRYSEVELFSGTVIKLGKQLGVPTPVNNFLYSKIKNAEMLYLEK